MHDPFDALGDENRREIIQCLVDAPRSVQDIADRLPISRPAVSRHLRVLKEAGLVSDSPRGTQRFYRLEVDGVQAIKRFLDEMWGDVEGRFRMAAENLDTERA